MTFPQSLYHPLCQSCKDRVGRQDDLGAGGLSSRSSTRQSACLIRTIAAVFVVDTGEGRTPPHTISEQLVLN